MLDFLVAIVMNGQSAPGADCHDPARYQAAVEAVDRGEFATATERLGDDASCKTAPLALALRTEAAWLAGDSSLAAELSEAALDAWATRGCVFHPGMARLAFIAGMTRLPDADADYFFWAAHRISARAGGFPRGLETRLERYMTTFGLSMTNDARVIDSPIFAGRPNYAGACDGMPEIALSNPLSSGDFLFAILDVQTRPDGRIRRARPFFAHPAQPSQPLLDSLVDRRIIGRPGEPLFLSLDPCQCWPVRYDNAPVCLPGFSPDAEADEETAAALAPD